MKKYITYFLIIVSLVGFFVPVFKASAQVQPGTCFVDGVAQSNWTTQSCSDNHGTWIAFYNLLAPIPCPTGSAGCDANNTLSTFDPSQANNLGIYLNLIVKIIIGICGVLAVVMIVMGGIEYMTSELVSSKEAGKERIRNALFGLILALFSWSLLYTINPDILKTDESSLVAQTVTVDLDADTPQPTPTNATHTYPTPGMSGLPFGTVLTDQNMGAIAQLPSGASVYNSQCTSVGQSGCTSTRGLSLSYINNILSNCPSCAPLSIQGGTEFWLHGFHSGSTSHVPNSATVDLAPTSALTNYILTGNPNTPGPTPGYFTRHTMNGISFLWESNHWHAGK